MSFRTQDVEELGDLAEINVTPLVDVMLVLLIIFMVTAPLLQQGIDVNLPKAKGKDLSVAVAPPAEPAATELASLTARLLHRTT